jgi:hypothetical protein
MLKLALRHAALAAALALPFAISSQGCGTAYSVCDVVCECTHCNDRTHDECIIGVDRLLDVGDAYDCSEDVDAYLDCVENDSDCDDTAFDANDCVQDELQDVFECLDDNSDILGNNVIGEGEGEGPPPGTGGAGGAAGVGGMGG